MGSVNQRTLTVVERRTLRLISSLTGLGLIKQVNMLFVCTKTTESKLVKMETGDTSPTMSVLWVNF